MTKNNKKTNAETLRDKVIELLKKNPRGLTIIELSKLTKVSTITVAKTLARLDGEGKVDIRRAGSAKLHYWRE